MIVKGKDYYPRCNLYAGLYFNQNCYHYFDIFNLLKVRLFN
jgi:hypothetical protein